MREAESPSLDRKDELGFTTSRARPALVRPIDKSLVEQAKRPINKSLVEQAKRPID
ncbi:MAG: hypothetical protein RBU37_14190 [Myxococcota bacterium]|nr:hypothetical protein [Myxococcota bacterium]